MLLRFEVSNHRSIMKSAELSMIAVDEDRPAARTFDRLNERVLTVAGIYGPNASGKSNVLQALSWLSEAVAVSLRDWDDYIPREPFKFGDGPTLASTFEIDLIVNGVRYTYILEITDTSVVFEGLYSYPERRRRLLFERENEDLRFRRGLGAFSGTRELLTPTTLALSAAIRFEGPEVRAFGTTLANIGILDAWRRWAPARNRRYSSSYQSMARYSTQKIFFDGVDPNQLPLFDEAEVDRLASRNSALELLRFADLGINDVEVVRQVIDSADAGGRVAGEPRQFLRLVHRVADQELPFTLGEESEGTQTWFRLIGPTVRALRTGQILLFDEIDASLHPKLSARLLELFQDPVTNPRSAQLIFTTHDTSLLNHLNRDEVWLTEKGADGATTLTALAEYGGDKVRRSVNLEKAYLQGRFGAVPEFDQYVLRRALGTSPDAQIAPEE